MILRIEDIDTTRCRPDLTEAIYQDLEWLGLTWPKPVRVQSEHFEDFETVVHDLRARGLAYRCFRTRAEIAIEASRAPHGPQPVFLGEPLPLDEEARRIEADDAFAWRLSLARCRAYLGPAWKDLRFTLETENERETVRAEPERHGDIIIARKDSPSAYHIAATHDDALQGVSHVIRGDDLADAPHIQTLLQVLMGWPQPTYRHHRLVMGADGKRLSKRDKSMSLAELRASGMTRLEIRQKAGLE